jgi:UDP-N-acetylenolpyruvoylglucosamine reductase
MPDPPGVVQRDYPLARLTTIRTGGAAELFARVSTIAELERLLAWASGEQVEVGVVGSGSNLLIADAGVRGLVVKLDKALSSIELDGTRIECGGGARLPAVSARAADAGLTGIEFGVNIPGTVGGAVRMNANAYGGELARALEWVDVVGPAGTDRRAPSQLGFAYRRSSIAPGEIVARASFALAPAERASVKATLADMRSRRKAASRRSARRSRIRTTRAPTAAPPASCSKPPAVVACESAAPGSRPSTRTSSRTRDRRRRPT